MTICFTARRAATEEPAAPRRQVGRCGARHAYRCALCSLCVQAWCRRAGWGGWGGCGSVVVWADWAGGWGGIAHGRRRRPLPPRGW